METRTQIRRVAVPMPDSGSAQPDRDEDHLDAVVLITDRGIQHTRNEDAGAAGTVPGALGERPRDRGSRVRRRLHLGRGAKRLAGRVGRRRRRHVGRHSPRPGT